MLTVGVDERGFDDEDRKPRAILAHENRLKALTRRHQLARQPDLLALTVLVCQFRRPIRRGHTLAEQLGGAETHHRAKRGVHIRDVPLQVACAQPGDKGVFHRLAERKCIGQVAFGTQAPPVVAHQHAHHCHQGNGHGRHQRREHVGKQVGRGVPAVHAQHQRAAGQIQEMLGGEHARAPARRAQNSQARAIGLRERGFLAAGEVVCDQVDEHVLQGVGGHEKAGGAAPCRQRHAQLHHLRAQAISVGLKVAARICGAAQAACVGAGYGEL